MTVANEFLRDRALTSIANLELIANADLSSRTSMRTNSNAAVLAIPHDPYALRLLIRLARDREWPLLVLGGGTNMIFATRRFEGIVVNLPKPVFGQTIHTDERVITVGCAASLGGVFAFSRKCNLMGLEFTSGIPGVLGGAIAGNAGAQNWGICDFVERVTVMTREGKVQSLNRSDFRFSYRHCELAEFIVLEAELLLEPLDAAISKQRVEDFLDKKKNQPSWKVPSSGCIFKNPRDPRTGDKLFAGKLIDEAGLKGYSLNGVQVSQMHANFLINEGGAAGEDFLAMISLIQDRVYDKSGVMLELEARIVGGPLTSCVLR